jgi:peptidoglycan-associated lipoprotein
MSIVKVIAAVAITLAVVSGCAHEQPKPTITAVRVVPDEPLPAKAPAPVQAPAPVATAATTPQDAAIYFDFDSAALRDEARGQLQKVATTARAQREALLIEGNCDETGTVEYNLALGENRARAARDYLLHLGVAPDRMHTMSYGSQHPKYPGHDEGARARNRRDDIRVQ